MIQSITVTNHLGESLEMILTQPELSGLIVKSIDGLGPSDATVNMTEIATMDGALLNSTRLNSKEIKIELILLDKPTIEDARQLTYKYFPIKKEVKLTVKTDNRNAYIMGVVEKNEPKIFSKQESVTITLKCAFPYFKSTEKPVEILSANKPLFEFPFEALMAYDEYDTSSIQYTDIVASLGLFRSKLVYSLPASIRYGWYQCWDTGLNTITWYVQKGKKIDNVVKTSYPKVYTTVIPESGINLEYKNTIGTVSGVNNSTVTYVPPSHPTYAGIQVKVNGKTVYIDTNKVWQIWEEVSSPSLGTLDDDLIVGNPGAIIYNNNGITVQVIENDDYFCIGAKVTISNNSSSVSVSFSTDLVTQEIANYEPSSSGGDNFVYVAGEEPVEVQDAIPELTRLGYKNSLWLFGQENSSIFMVFGITEKEG